MTIVLIIATISSATFAGVIAAMAGVIQWMLNDLNYAGYRVAMQGIIWQGRRSPIIWILLLTPIVSSGVALYLLAAEANQTVFWLVITGAGLYLLGAILVSRILNEPFYDVVMQWEADTEPENWQKMRMKWFRYNILRLSISAISSISFSIALLAV